MTRTTLLVATALLIWMAVGIGAFTFVHANYARSGEKALAGVDVPPPSASVAAIAPARPPQTVGPPPGTD